MKERGREEEGEEGTRKERGREGERERGREGGREGERERGREGGSYENHNNKKITYIRAIG